MLRNKFTAPIIGLVVSSVMLLLTLSTAGPAFAADPCTASTGTPVTCNTTETASITASAGTLALNVNNGTNGTISFGSPTVGTSSALTSLPIEVDDNRGSTGTGTTSNGWTVNISVPSTLSNTGATHTFSPTWSYEQSPACTVASPANCTVPASGTCPTVSSPAALSTGGANVCNSGTASDAGEGAVTLGTQLQISVPDSAVPDTYTGTITVTVTSDT